MLGLGADLEPETMLAACSRGLFPMPVAASPDAPIGWISPDPRAAFVAGRVHCARSLRRSARRFAVTVDEAFSDVVAACADPRRPDGWIDDRMFRAYLRLHSAGWAHSIEVWSAAGDELAGGLFGIEIGGLFAAESMFHRAADASKVALVALGEIVRAASDAELRIIDAQWGTDHLRRMGAEEIGRGEYLRRLTQALPLPPAVGAVRH